MWLIHQFNEISSAIEQLLSNRISRFLIHLKHDPNISFRLKRFMKSAMAEIHFAAF